MHMVILRKLAKCCRTQSVSSRYFLSLIIKLFIGVRSATMQQRLQTNNGWVNKVVPVYPLDGLVEKYISTKTIDFVTMDLEGAEFPILDALKYDGHLTKVGVVICQVLSNYAVLGRKSFYPLHCVGLKYVNFVGLY